MPKNRLIPAQYYRNGRARIKRGSKTPYIYLLLFKLGSLTGVRHARSKAHFTQDIPKKRIWKFAG